MQCPCDAAGNRALFGEEGVLTRICSSRSNNHTEGTSGRKMNSLRYEAPSSLGDAIALLAGASGTSRILAGGTDVIVQMETDLIEPDLVVDIKKIPELRQIAVENGVFRVGAAVTGMELTDHEAFCKAWPGAARRRRAPM